MSTYKQNRQVRVFISSTFLDMQDERDVLAKHVFPEIRRRCQARKVDFLEIDLRWGITESQAERGEVIPICLTRIEDAHPYFMGFLGERYGAVIQKPDMEHVFDTYPWLKNYVGRSITEFEILHALFDVGQNVSDADRQATIEHALFYFRDPNYAYSQSEEKRADFVGSADNQKQQQDLKQRIRDLDCQISDYQKPMDLKDLVIEPLWALIEQDFPEGSQPTDKQRETLEHDAYAHHLCQFYQGRSADFDPLTAHALGDNPKPLVILGEAGSGKSALLANWAHDYQANHPDDFVFWHFCGPVEGSSNPIVVMQRLSEALQHWFDIDERIAYTPQALMHLLSTSYLQNLQQRIIVIIDAVNQLEHSQNADLNAILNVMPAEMRLIVSTWPNHETWQTLQMKGPCPTLTVQPLSVPERGSLLTGYLQRYGKTLEYAQLQRLATAPPTANTLYLQIILQELRFYKGTFRDFDQQITDYLKADSIAALYQQVLQRLETDYQSWEEKPAFWKKWFAQPNNPPKTYPHLVENALTLLWASQRGLTETELLTFLQVPQAVWSPLYLALQTALINRSGLLHFANADFRQAVEQLYLTDIAQKRAAHRQLANYFEHQPTDSRKADELPYQLEQAGEKTRLQACITEIPMFLQLLKTDGSGAYTLLGYWRRLEKQDEMIAAYQQALAEYEKTVVGKDLAHALTQFAAFCWTMGVVTESIIQLARKAVKLFEQVLGEWHPDTVTSLNNLAELLRTKGEYDEAEPLYRQTLAIHKQVLGEWHPDTATSLNNLALLLQDKGEYDEAESLHRQALAIDEQVLGKQHSSTARDLNNLAGLLKTKGKYDQAEPLHRQALEISEQVLGEWHPSTATFLNNLAGLLYNQGNYNAAEPLLRQALEILENVLGHQHPNTVLYRNNLADLLKQKEKASGRTAQTSQPAPVYPQVEMSVGVNQPKQQKISRNALCPCGSGKRYKNCCGALKF